MNNTTCPHCKVTIDLDCDPCEEDREEKQTWGLFRVRRKLSPEEYRRNKLNSMRHNLRQITNYFHEYREHLWKTGQMHTPEFHFLVGVEQLYRFCKDMLNQQLDENGMTRT